MMFKTLSKQEQTEYKQWAQDNYKPFTEIKGIWHPVVQQECVEINFLSHLQDVILKSERAKDKDNE